MFKKMEIKKYLQDINNKCDKFLDIVFDEYLSLILCVAIPIAILLVCFICFKLT